jgi:uncharacterized protein
MKKVSHQLCFIIIALALIAPALRTEEAVPAITAPVNDYAGIITPDREKKLSDMIVAHMEKTGVQMAVLTVGTTGQMPIEEFSIKTAEKWGGGTKERDDGLLFTVAVNDRRMRIEVGYGLEGYITDLKAGRMLDGIREDFRNKNYDQGIEKVVSQIINATDDLRPGEKAPTLVRTRGAFFNFLSRFHIVYYLMGAMAGLLFMYAKGRGERTIIIGGWHFQGNFPLWLTILVSIVIFVLLPALLQMFLPGVGIWAPVVFITGALSGAGITRALMVPRLKVFATVRAAIPAALSLGGIIWCLHVLKPLQMSVAGHEECLAVILVHANVFQILFLCLSNWSISDGESSCSSSGDSYSSSDSGGSSYSGGGGDFGGGGASSDW